MSKIIEMEKEASEKVTESFCEDVEAGLKNEVIERPYTLRELKDSDLIPLVKLLRDIGLKELKKALNEQAQIDKEDIERAGKMVAFDMADMIINNLDTHYNEICEFWSGLSGIPAEEISEMEFGTLPLMIYDSYSEVKNTAFFKVLSKLL